MIKDVLEGMGRNDLERSWIGHDDSLGVTKRLMTGRFTLGKGHDDSGD